MEIVFLLIGLWTGYLFFSPSNQSIIEDFKNPTCIEKTIGKDLIKKCYEIKEVKND